MILPVKMKTIEPCKYCGYSIGVGEIGVPVGQFFYHFDCAEAHPNIEVDLDEFNRRVDSGEWKV